MFWKWFNWQIKITLKYKSIFDCNILTKKLDAICLDNISYQDMEEKV